MLNDLLLVTMRLRNEEMAEWEAEQAKAERWRQLQRLGCE